MGVVIVREGVACCGFSFLFLLFFLSFSPFWGEEVKQLSDEPILAFVVVEL